MSVFIIAEAGSCHDGDLAKARGLVYQARQAGADAVKFQFWSSAERLAMRRRVDDRYYDIYKHYQMPKDWIPELRDECARQNIEFMCTTYMPEDIHFINPWIKRFKIASFEATDQHFILCHLPFGKPLIISTGMMAINDVRTIIDLIRYALKDSNDRDLASRITLLHCVSTYPAPVGSLNLRVIRGSYDFCFQGFSDHTANVYMGAIAVGFGAQVLEVHFRHEYTSHSNPDFTTALSPRRLTEYIGLARMADEAGGKSAKALQEAEREMAQYRVVVGAHGGEEESGS